MSGGSYSTFLDYPSIYVVTSVVGLLLLSWVVAWSFGYRKSFADHAEQA
jgi:hypothetical protein